MGRLLFYNKKRNCYFKEVIDKFKALLYNKMKTIDF